MAAKSLNYYLTYWMLILASAAVYVDAQSQRAGLAKSRRKKSKRGREKVKKAPFYGWRFVLFLFLLCFIPPVFTFVYNLYKDPMAPTLWKNGLEMVREKMLGFLSTYNQPRRRHTTKTE